MSSPVQSREDKSLTHRESTKKVADLAPQQHGDIESGVVHPVTTLQQVLSGRRMRLLWVALAVLSTVVFLDNSTTYAYLNYAASDFNSFSLLAAISTASIITTAIIQPPIAKLSDVIGRGWAFMLCVVFQVLSFGIMAGSSSLGMYAAGYIIYTIGVTGILVLGQIAISDFTSSRSRAIGVALFYSPSMVMPLVSSFIVDAVVNGIGWRWGLGMFCIIYAACGIWLPLLLLYAERKARKSGLVKKERLTIVSFSSKIDLGGNLLICAGLGLVLLPIILAGSATKSFKTPYLQALIVLGVVSMIALIAYEHWVAKHPILPLRYFKNKTIVFVLALAFCDYFAINVTHTYFYSWAVVARNFSARDANFLLFTSTCTQVFVGLVIGLISYSTRRYKWMVFVGTIIRTIGFGVMLRLRGANNSVAELFIVQVIQGIGSGILETLLIVAIQIVVTHAEMAQITGILQLFKFSGAAISVAVAGTIYINCFESALSYRLGPDVDPTLVATVYESITTGLPDWGTTERVAISEAYSDIMRYMIISAVAMSGPMLIISPLLPNHTLGGTHNLVESAPANPLSKSVCDGDGDHTEGDNMNLQPVSGKGAVSTRQVQTQ